jgi:catechol 2,3-dioxygenase-like lactoylglutathione lyase family enzyme
MRFRNRFIFICLISIIVLSIGVHSLYAQTHSPAATGLASLQADHVMLRVPNFEETMQWYKDKFGFTEVIRWQEPSLPGVDLAYLELNGFRLEILGGGEPPPEQAIAIPTDVPIHTRFQGYRHLCFRTDDVDKTLAELNQRGVPTFAEAYNYAPLQRRLAFVLDNNGNAIELSGPISEAPVS